jgi:hypothetical protein
VTVTTRLSGERDKTSSMAVQEAIP